MPWYEFSRIVGEMQSHEERAGGMLLPALGIALVTLVAAMLAPRSRSSSPWRAAAPSSARSPGAAATAAASGAVSRWWGYPRRACS